MRCFARMRPAPTSMASRLEAEGITVLSCGIVAAVARRRVSRRGRAERRVRAFWKTVAVARKELRQIRRDRRTLLILLFVPVFFLLIYGYALNFDIRNVRLAVQDNDRSSASRELISAFVNSGYFDLVGEAAEPGGDRRLLDRGDARAVLVIPGRFGADVASGRRDGRPVHRERRQREHGHDRRWATRRASSTPSRMRYEVQARIGSPTGPILTIEPRVWYNPELRSTLFLVPGLIAYIAMLTAVVSTALSIVREKEAGTMEQVRMSPIGPVPYVLGKTAPYFVVSLISSMSIVVAAIRAVRHADARLLGGPHRDRVAVPGWARWRSACSSRALPTASRWHSRWHY